jgi:hypothetical protein
MFAPIFMPINLAVQSTMMKRAILVIAARNPRLSCCTAQTAPGATPVKVAAIPDLFTVKGSWRRLGNPRFLPASAAAPVLTSQGCQFNPCYARHKKPALSHEQAGFFYQTCYVCCATIRGSSADLVQVWSGPEEIGLHAAMSIRCFNRGYFARPYIWRLMAFIPPCIDQNLCAHWRRPMDMMRQG